MKTPGMQDLVEALASYTQRHFVRLDRLVRSSFLLDYTLASMNVLMPEGEEAGVAASELERLESLGTDVDERTGTDVDTDAFMQSAAEVQADEEMPKMMSGQQTAAPVQPVPSMQAVRDDDGLQAARGELISESNLSSKRRKSAPQTSTSIPPAVQAQSQIVIKAKRMKVQ